MKKIVWHCPTCKEYSEVGFTQQEEFHCPQCQAKWGEVKNKENLFDTCPMCPARQFYLSKNFNQFVGLLVMLVGIVLVPWTYGLSMPFFAFFVGVLSADALRLIQYFCLYLTALCTLTCGHPTGCQHL